jgi:hypothetical protein
VEPSYAADAASSSFLKAKRMALRADERNWKTLSSFVISRWVKP